MNILLSGAPQTGKTTHCRLIMDSLNRNMRGFVTEEIRHEGERVGFMVEFDNGASRVLSHVNIDGPRVGKYGVDLETMDWVISTIETWNDEENDIYIVDEVGKMELKHDDFPEKVEDLLDSDNDLLATLPRVGSDFVGEIRSRNDVRNIELTDNNREETLNKLVDLLDISAEQQ